MSRLSAKREKWEGKLSKKLQSNSIDTQFTDNDHSDQAWMDYIP